jgi:nicotinate-nucleotide--dimethylbenzimidazole phosphoribosyltransferase
MPEPAASPRNTEPESVTGGLEDIRSLVMNDLTPAPAVTAGGEQHGQFAPVWRWLAQAQHEQRPRIRHPRIGLFMAAHGAFPERQQDLRLTLKMLNEGKHPIAPLAEQADCDLQVYELDLSGPSADFRKAPALTAAAAGHAISYGLMAVQPGIDLLAIAALNPVADLAGERIAAALKEKTDPFKALLLYGGLDIAAMFGLAIAAQLARMPVLLEGKGALAAGALLRALRPEAAAHLRNVNDIQPKQAATVKPGTAGALAIPFLKTIAHR